MEVRDVVSYARLSNCKFTRLSSVREGKLMNTLETDTIDVSYRILSIKPEYMRQCLYQSICCVKCDSLQLLIRSLF